MSGGVPAGDVAAIVSLIGDIAMWSGNQKLTEKAFALSQQIATPTPPIEGRDADVERVARALCVADGLDPDESIVGGQATGFEDFGPLWQAEDRSEGQLGLTDYTGLARAALQALGERG